MVTFVLGMGLRPPTHFAIDYWIAISWSKFQSVATKNAIELNDLEVIGSVSHYHFPKPSSLRVFPSVFWKETSVVQIDAQYSTAIEYLSHLTLDCWVSLLFIPLSQAESFSMNQIKHYHYDIIYEGYMIVAFPTKSLK